MRRKIWVVGIIAILALVVFFLISRNRGGIVIGWIGPLSGDYASYGQKVKVGTEIAVDEINACGGINGHHLEVLYEDDQLDPTKGIAAFNKLVSINGVPLVIQAAGSTVMLAEAPLAEREEVVLISPTCTNPEISNAGEYVFRIAPSDNYQGEVIAGIARTYLNANSAAVLYINNDYGVGLKDVFLPQFEKAGGRVLLSEGFSSDARDFRALLSKVKELKPNVVFLSALYSEAALVLKQAQELGVATQFIGGDGCFAPELIERAGAAAEGMIVINMQWDLTSEDPKVRHFISQVKERTGTVPEVYAALGYDCLHVVADAMKRSETHSISIKDALLQTDSLPGLTGPTSFDKNGDVLKAYDLFWIHDGAFQKKR